MSTDETYAERMLSAACDALHDPDLFCVEDVLGTEYADGGRDRRATFCNKKWQVSVYYCHVGDDVAVCRPVRLCNCGSGMPATECVANPCCG